MPAVVATDLGADVQQSLGAAVVDGVHSVVRHRVTAHQAEVLLKSDIRQKNDNEPPLH